MMRKTYKHRQIFPLLREIRNSGQERRNEIRI